MDDADRVNVPDCLTEGKAAFAKQRMLETALGGVRVYLPTRPPWYVPAFQVGVFLLPVIAGIVCCAVITDAVVCGAVVGGVIAALVAALQLAGVCVRRKSGGSVGGSGAVDDLLDILAVDGDVEFEAFWDEDTWRFLVPPKGVAQTLATAIAGAALGFAATCVVHPAATSGGDGSMGSATGAGIVALIYGWLVVGLAAFSLTCAPPPEMARWDASSGGHTSPSAAFNRPIAVVVLALPATIVAIWKTTVSPGVTAGLDVWLSADALSGAGNLATAAHLCAALFYLLPLLWTAGIMPPARAMAEASVELVMTELAGSSPVFSSGRLFLQLVANAVVVAVAYVLATNLGAGWAVGVSFALTLVLDRTVLSHSWDHSLCGGRGKCCASKSSSTRARVIPVASTTPPGSASPATPAARSDNVQRMKADIMGRHSVGSYPASVTSVAVGADATAAHAKTGTVHVAPRGGDLVARRVGPKGGSSTAVPQVVSVDRDAAAARRGCVGALGPMDGVALLLLGGGSVAAGAALPTGCVGASGLDCLDMSNTLVAVAGALVAVAWLLASLQRPFVCGRFRNPLWQYEETNAAAAPGSRPRRRGLLTRRWDGVAYRAVSLVLMLVVMLWAVLVLPLDALPGAMQSSDAAAATWLVFWTSVAARRLAQRTLATPMAAAWDLMLVHVLAAGATAGVATNPTESGWRALSLWVRLAVAGMIVRRVPDMWGKAWYMCTHLVTSVTEKKLRYDSARKVALASAIMSPVVAATAAFSSVFMSPVLPVLGLPIFLPAFPRPVRQWQVVSRSESASSTDAALYQQLVPQLSQSLQWLLQRGVLGEVEAGACFIVRMETLVAAVQVLEVGRGRTVVSVRGLEQQQPTSCHNVEAGVLDKVFAQINRDEGGLKGANAFVSNTVTPAGVMPVMAYTASKMAMVGVLDRGDVLKCIDAVFYRTLLLLLHRYALVHFGGVPEEWMAPCQLSYDDLEVARRRYPREFLARMLAAGDDTGAGAGAGSGDVATPVTGPPRPASREDPASANASPYASASVDGGDVPSGAHVVSASGNSRHSSANSAARAGGFVLDEPDSPAQVGGFGAPGPPRTGFQSHTGSYDAPRRASAEHARRSSDVPDVASALHSAVTSEGDADDLDALLADVMGDDSPAPAPAPRYTSAPPRRRAPSPEPVPAPAPAPLYEAPPLQAPAVRYSRNEDRKEGYSAAGGNSRMQPRQSSAQSTAVNGSDDDFIPRLEKVVQSCYAVLQVSGLGCCDGDAEAAGPQHVLEIFKGGVPTSLGASWLTEKKPLLRVCLRAYRLAVKAAIDAGVMMECEDIVEDTEDSHTDLMDVLEELQTKWFIGLDTSPQWVDAIVRETPHLFCLNAKDNDRGRQEFSGHLLTLHEQPAFVGWVNSAALMGIWASLSQELLFFTNDDDERYSIQAHKSLLRNLSIQMAQPPLGYPVWNSGPVVLRGAAL